MTPVGGRHLDAAEHSGRSPLRRALAGVLSGSAMGQLIVLCTAPILTRLYSPDAFGAYGVFASIVAVGTSLLLLRLDTAMLAADTTQEARVLGRLAFVPLLIGVVLTVPIAVLLLRHLSVGLHWPLALAGSVTILAVGANQIAIAWMTRLRKYGMVATRTALQGIVQSGTQVSLGLIGAGTGLIAGMAAGRLPGMAGLFSHWGLFRKTTDEHPSWRIVLNRYRRFPLVSSWSGLLNSAGVQAPTVLIAAAYGATGAGVITLVSRVLGAPVALISTAIAPVLLGEISHYRGSQAVTLIRKTLTTLAALGLLPTIAIMIFAPWAAERAFGHEWRLAGDAMQILAPAYLAQFAVTPISQTLLIYKKNSLQFYWDATRLILVTCAILLPHGLGLGFETSLITLALSQIFTYSTMAYLALRVTRKAISHRSNNDTRGADE